MSCEIIEVMTKKDLKKFVNFPNQLYKGNRYYVPSLISDDLNTLDKKKNPAFEYSDTRFWLAYQNGVLVGRVGAIYNKLHEQKWGQKYLRFSWLDFIDDLSVSGELLLKIENWARELGLQAIHGPLGFTDLDREGMLVEGFNELATMATFYNHPYYPKHMEQHGYKKDIDWIEFLITVPSNPDEKISRAAQIVLKRNQLKLLVFKNKKQMLSYGKELFHLLVDEYKELYGVNPLTEKEIDSYINQYISFVPPDFIPVLLDDQGKMVAFGIAIPSLSIALQKTKGRIFPFGWIHLLKAIHQNDRADLMLVAVKKAYQGLGLQAVMMDQMTKVFIKRRISFVESNPELETNTNVQSLWKLYDKRQHKRRRIFIKHLV